MSTKNRIVSRKEWTAARKALLEKEKAFTRERDALSAERQALPMVRVEKSYVFDEPSGKAALADLFDGHRQLLVYHFMFDPSWDEGCRGCSYVVDHVGGAVAHLAARGTAFAAVSRAPVAKIEAFKKRMGWSFRWLSSAGSDFNYDFHVSFRPEEAASKTVDYNYGTVPYEGSDKPGLSAFLRDGADVFHTYSTYERGLEFLISTYSYLDLTPLGRQEGDLSFPMAWVRHHDKYVAA